MIENPSLFNQTLLLNYFIFQSRLWNTDLQELSSRENVTSEELANALQDHYVLYVNQHKEKYSQFLKNVAFGDIPIVFHCFAGKAEQVMPLTPAGLNGC